MKLVVPGAVAALSIVAFASQANAQLARSPLLDGDVSSIRAEVTKRYEAALAATRAREVVAANDVRYTWASEAKVACGIALGFLKTRTVDEDSIDKCDDYARRMEEARPLMAPPPAPASPAPPPPPAEAPCAVQLPISFYFEWNSDAPPPEADEVATTLGQQMRACGWSSLAVSGHADSSGPDEVNQALSERRARNVADLLVAKGVPAGSLRVEGFGETRPAKATGDGVREPLNRRVEIAGGAAQ
jgi:outer membrane protein OmpA-like peptidoglycan-associated protein